MAQGGWPSEGGLLPAAAPARARPARCDGQRGGWRRGGWRRGSGWRELALGLAIFALYLYVTRKVQVSHAAADAHAGWLMRIESTLHVDIERPLDTWLARHPTLGALAAWEYATTYIVTTFGFLGWLWWRRRRCYRWARGVLVVTTLIAIACFALWPLTPPRLLPGSGFADVVSAHSPFLSWGSGTVSAGADQWAAMPSLHIGWAAWVTLVSVRGGAGAWGRSLSALHLLVTSYVVVGTGNHYVLDIVGGFAVVGLGVAGYAAWRVALRACLGFVRDGGRGAKLPSADAFFLHVETPHVPQIVGGVALLDTTPQDAVGALDIEQFRSIIGRRLPELPQFRRRLRPGGPLRRPRWEDAEHVDLRYHIRAARAPGGGRRGLERLVADRSSRPLDLHRPPWRIWVVRGVGPNEAAVIVLVHHAVGDGLAVVDILRHLLDPPLPTRVPARAPAPGRLARVAMTALGVAKLALDGGAQRLPFAGAVGPARTWRTLEAPLREVRTVARASHTDVTAVLLAAIGEVAAEVLDERGHERHGARMRVAVPITLRRPTDRSDAPPGRTAKGTVTAAGNVTAAQGNVTAALRIDVPLDDMTPTARLAAVHESARRKRSPSRVLATAAVVRDIGWLPRPLHRLAAKAMYRSRFFAAIATNMPGPSFPMSFSGLPLKDVYPVIPLAQGVPLAAGTLAWNGRMCLSVTADPALLPEADDIDVRLEEALARIADAVGGAPGPGRDPAQADGVPPVAPAAQAATQGTAQAGVEGTAQAGVEGTAQAGSHGSAQAGQAWRTSSASSA